MDAVQKLDAIKAALRKVQAEEESLLGDVGGGAGPSDGARALAKVGLGLASLAGSASLGYHGYKRNGDSYAWGLWWWIVGGAFPVGTVIGGVLAWDQGYARPIGSGKKPAPVTPVASS